MDIVTVKIVDGSSKEFEIDLRQPTPEEEDEYLIKRKTKVVNGRAVDDSSTVRKELFDLLVEGIRCDGENIDKDQVPGRFKYMSIFQAFENFSVEVLEKN